jgi:hypothetical protein
MRGTHARRDRRSDESEMRVPILLATAVLLAALAAPAAAIKCHVGTG